MPYYEQALAFACGADSLPAIVTLPQQPGPRGVLVIVGGPQYRAGSHRQFTLLARSLAAQGIPVMRFDARGMGDGEGTPRTFEDIGADVRAAADCFMQAVPGLRDIVLWGLCDGAAAAMLYGADDARVSGLVLLNPWARDEGRLAKTMLKHYYLRRLVDPALWRKILSGRFDVRGSAASLAEQVRKVLQQTPSAAVTVTALPDDLLSVHAAPAAVPPPAPPLGPRLYAGLQRFHGPVLFVISPADMTAMEFQELAGSTKAWRKLMQAPRITRRELPGADHTFSSRAWRDQVAEWTGQWLRSW
ncbi:hydrolase 1, exosortase A system-associated [Duganella ginsengisoli]|uniref:Hydrolase 1, exosortase A system-associated n=2 Tax=Pseudoduganella ginsengisoli TaxID=1462440 RepID=A0A6L6Q0Q1_9BURK|nr:hydrolase 1, exosortase A system-associated [Pseudoduganella ginsengisoli]